MESRVIKHLTGAMVLAASFIFSASAVFGAWQPGLQWGSVTGGQMVLDTYPAVTNTDLSIGMAKTTAGWGANTTYVYWGQIYLDGSTYRFAESIDDAAWLKIGNGSGSSIVLNNTAWNSTSFGNIIPNNSATPWYTGEGWYDFELRIGNGGGGAGPVAANGFTSTLGFGYVKSTDNSATSVTTADWIMPEDSGNALILRYDDGKGFNEALVVSANLPSSVMRENPEFFAPRTTLEIGTVSISVPDEVFPIDDISRYHRVGYALTAYDDAAGDYVTPVATTMSDDGTTLSFNYAEGGRYQLLWNYDLEYRVQCSAADATLGTVTISPTDGWVKEGGSVTVTATPNDAEAYYFLRWKDSMGKTYRGSPASITVTGALTLSAVFWQVGAPVGIEVSSDDLVDGYLPLDTIVANASEGDEIIIAAGTYKVKCSSIVAMNRRITLRGATENPADVTLEYHGGFTLQLTSADAVVRDLTLNGNGQRFFKDKEFVQFPSSGTGGSLINCVVENAALDPGCNGIVSMKGPGTVSHCVFRAINYRDSVNGMTVAIMHTDAIVRNSLITGNSWCASWVGAPNVLGAVYLTAGTLENCTIAGNRSTQYSGVYATGGTVRNCLIGGNALTEEGANSGNPNVQVYKGTDAVFEYCVVPEAVEGQKIYVVDEPFADAEYRPALRTSIINAGSNQSWMETATDLAGNSRIVNDTVDIGAYESAEMPDTTPIGIIKLQGADCGIAPFERTFSAVLENCGESDDIHYTWNFGDGTTETGIGLTTVTHRFETGGEYQVSLSIKNETAGLADFTLPEALPVYANAATTYVAPAGTENVDSAFPYATPGTAAPTLRAALEHAADECDIVLLKGRHFFDKEEVFNLSLDIDIRGETGKPEDVVLLYGETNGAKNNWNNRFFAIYNNAVVIRDLTLDGDSTKALGTGVHGRLVYMVSGGTVTNCILRNVNAPGSQRSSGGAVFIEGPGIVSHCVISNCSISALNGGNDDWCRGTAVYLKDGRLEDCLLTGNFVDYDDTLTDWRYPDMETGGTVAISGGEVVNCTIVGNSAWDCAGVYAVGKKGKVVNTIIAGNASEYTGDDATVTAAVWKGQNADDNSIFSHCFSDTLKINDNCLQGIPLFIDPVNGDYHLSASSPCVDAGTVENVTLSKVDLDGKRRVLRRKPDIGCYELRKYGLKIMLR